MNRPRPVGDLNVRWKCKEQRLPFPGPRRPNLVEPSFDLHTEYDENINHQKHPEFSLSYCLQPAASLQLG